MIENETVVEDLEIEKEERESFLDDFSYPVHPECANKTKKISKRAEKKELKRLKRLKIIERIRIRTKTKRLRSFWKLRSDAIPNVFRLFKDVFNSNKKRVWEY